MDKKKIIPIVVFVCITIIGIIVGFNRNSLYESDEVEAGRHPSKKVEDLSLTPWDNQNDPSNPPENPDEQIYISSIILNGCNSLVIGGSETISAEIIPNEANDKTLQWASSNESVVSISDGVATGLAEGTSTITALNPTSGVQGACTISVKKEATEPDQPKPTYVSSITLSGCNNLVVGGSEEIITSILPSNADDNNLQWGSTQPGVATVSNGVVTANSAGKTTIIAKNNASGVQGACTITVNNPPTPTPQVIKVTSIQLSGCNTLPVGGSENISATVLPSNANDKSLQWYSSNSGVATVSNGKVTAVGTGTATITAKNNASGVTGTCTITVSNLAPQVTTNVEYYFLSTNSDTINHSEAIIMKTKGGKYVLLDVGVDDANSARVIVEKLQSLQGTSKPVIDYLIISHAHMDHMGGLKRLKGKITVKNYIVKDTQHGNYNGGSVSNYVSSTVGGSRTRINSEGQEIAVDGDLVLKFYNIGDAYANKSCASNLQLWLRAPKKDGSTNGDFETFSVDGKQKYIYISGREYRNGIYQYHTSDTVFQISDESDHFDFNYFFKIKSYTEKYYTCDENANSYAILAKTANKRGNERYAYFPSDLENIGYTVFPDASDGMIGGAYTATFTSKPTFTTGGTNGGHFNNHSNVVKVNSETKIAKKVASYLGNNLNKLVIYQASHHGYNTAPDVATILGLNKSTVYSITTTGLNFSNTKNFSLARTWYYTLKNSKKFNTGQYNELNGIYCYIKSNGEYSCSKY